MQSHHKLVQNLAETAQYGMAHQNQLFTDTVF